MNNQNLRTEIDSIDPDPIALLGLVFSGLALVATLGQTLQANRQYNDEASENECRLALSRINSSIDIISKFLNYLSEQNISPLLSETGELRRFGSYGLFLNQTQLDDFNNQLDELLGAISTISRNVLSMPLHRLNLSPESINTLNFRRTRIRFIADRIFDAATPQKSIEDALEVAGEAKIFTAEVGAILGLEPPSEEETIRF